jgi:hypothetical protein
MLAVIAAGENLNLVDWLLDLHYARSDFYIRFKQDGRWHAMLENQSLGAYVSAVEAHRDLVRYNTNRPRNGVNTSRIALPTDLVDWKFIDSAKAIGPTVSRAFES